jgi:hypothetical protein
VESSGFRVQGSGFRVQGSRVQVSGFRVHGSEGFPGIEDANPSILPNEIASSERFGIQNPWHPDIAAPRRIQCHGTKEFAIESH